MARVISLWRIGDTRCLSCPRHAAAAAAAFVPDLLPLWLWGKRQRQTKVGVVPNATSYTGAIAACSRVGDGDKALEWLKIMSDEGIAPEVLQTDMYVDM